MESKKRKVCKNKDVNEIGFLCDHENDDEDWLDESKKLKAASQKENSPEKFIPVKEKIMSVETGVQTESVNIQELREIKPRTYCDGREEEASSENGENRGNCFSSTSDQLRDSTSDVEQNPQLKSSAINDVSNMSCETTGGPTMKDKEGQNSTIGTVPNSNLMGSEKEFNQIKTNAQNLIQFVREACNENNNILSILRSSEERFDCIGDVNKFLLLVSNIMKELLSLNVSSKHNSSVDLKMDCESRALCEEIEEKTEALTNKLDNIENKEIPNIGQILSEQQEINLQLQNNLKKTNDSLTSYKLQMASLENKFKKISEKKLKNKDKLSGKVGANLSEDGQEMPPEEDREIALIYQQYNLPSSIILKCHSISIGLYTIHPEQNSKSIDVTITDESIAFSAPFLTNCDKSVQLILKKSKILKTLAHFGKCLPVIFAFTSRTFRKALNMPKTNNQLYDPTSEDPKINKITFLIADLNKEKRKFMRHIFPGPDLLQKIELEEANKMLDKSTLNESKPNLEVICSNCNRLSSNMIICDGCHQKISPASICCRVQTPPNTPSNLVYEIVTEEKSTQIVYHPSASEQSQSFQFDLPQKVVKISPQRARPKKRSKPACDEQKVPIKNIKYDENHDQLFHQDESGDIKSEQPENSKNLPEESNLAVLCSHCNTLSLNMTVCDGCHEKISPEAVRCTVIFSQNTLPIIVTQNLTNENSMRIVYLPRVTEQSQSFQFDQPQKVVKISPQRGQPKKRSKSACDEQKIPFKILKHDGDQNGLFFQSESAQIKSKHSSSSENLPDMVSSKGSTKEIQLTEPILEDFKDERQEIHAEEDEKKPLIDKQYNLPSYIVLKCRSIKIGSHKILPQQDFTSIDVMITDNEITFPAPLSTNCEKLIHLKFRSEHIYGARAHFGKDLPILFVFIYTNVNKTARRLLQLPKTESKTYNTTIEDMGINRITFLIDVIKKQQRRFMRYVFPGPDLLKEIDQNEANEFEKSIPNETSGEELMQENQLLQLSDKEVKEEKEVSPDEQYNLSLSKLLKFEEEKKEIPSGEKNDKKLFIYERYSLASKIILECRRIRIGSYKIQPEEHTTHIDVLIRYSKTIEFSAPFFTDDATRIKLILRSEEIHKVKGYFSKSLVVLFVFTSNQFGEALREVLHMPNENNLLYDPSTDDERRNKITFMVDGINKEQRMFMRKIFPGPEFLEEISKEEVKELIIGSTLNPVHPQVGATLKRKEAKADDYLELSSTTEGAEVAPKYI